MIQVVGAGGMLGEAVCHALENNGIPYIIGKYDITVVESRDIDGDIVINCAGMIKQLSSISNSRYILVNGYAPHRLAEACVQAGARLVHISTDCVFNGCGPHSEIDLMDGTGIYARSKMIGEIEYAPHLTLRTSFVGESSRGLIYDLRTKKSIIASNRLLWTGNIVQETAELIISAANSSLSGILHMPGCEMTRLDLCNVLARHLSLSVDIIRDDSFVADRRLDFSKWVNSGLPLPRTFDEQMDRYL